MPEMLISAFKAKCIEVLNAVHDRGETVIVTRRGKPLARIVPVDEPPRHHRELAASPGEMVIHGDIVHAGFEKDWEALK